MKLYKKIILGVAACVSLSACDDWLDVNTNPNTPISTDAEFHQRLPWMQFYMEHIYHIVASNTSFYCGHFYRNNAREGGAAKWQLDSSTRAANAQQWFFTQVGVNCNDLYNQAMEAGAYHYAGAAKFFRAYGFMMLTDLFGEIPYNDAFGENPSPAYDNGKTIFLGCITDIDEAIELFSKQQEAINNVTPVDLVEGDSWNGGSFAYPSETTYGNGYWNRYYLAVTKHVIFQNIGELGAHLTWIYSTRFDNNLNSPAIGVNFQLKLKGKSLINKLVNGVNLMVEVVPGYTEVNEDLIFNPDSPKYQVNLGMTYSVWKDYINLVGELNRCKYLSAGVFFRVHLK